MLGFFILRQGLDVIIPATRADARPDIPDTTLYVFNFADDLGYAVTSANKKYGNTLFCITELGSLSADDFKPLRTRADGDSLATGNNCTHFITDLITASIMSNEIAPPIDSTEIGGGPSGIIGPFLKTKWGQDDSPINDSIPNNAPAGCACIALSQIMAFEEYSNTMVFNGITCNWSDIKTVYTYPNIYYPGSNTGKVQVASFIKALGTSTNLDINYNNGSGGTITKAKTTLQNYGYSNVTLTPALAPSPTFTQEMKSKVRSQLFSGHPVYARGIREGFMGHAWVIDGYYAGLYHINWGWHGKSDGYFNEGIFNVSNRVGIASIDPGTVKEDPYNYSSLYRILTYSH